MKTTLRLYPVLSFFAISLLLSCTTSSQTKLPDTWQPGMKLTMSYGGGMRYYSYNIEISDTGSFYSVNNEGTVTTSSLNITSKDLQELLALLKKHRLDRIRTETKGLIYDKGTQSIALSWSGNYIGASDGSTTAIAEKSMEDFNAISTWVFQLVEKSKEKVKDK